MLHRAATKRLLVIVTILSGAMCALSGAPWIAAAHWSAAVALVLSRFGRPVEARALEVLIATLREAYRRDTAIVETIRATLTSRAIFTRLPAANHRWWHPCAVAFRDEASAEQWRHVVTGLRHQRRSLRQLSSNHKIYDR